MGISKKNKSRWQQLSSVDQERITRMAWEDRTSFENINLQFGLSPNEVEKFMRTQLSPQAYRRWRRRASERGHLKQGKKRPVDARRFKCSRQRPDGSTKGWK